VTWFTPEKSSSKGRRSLIAGQAEPLRCRGFVLASISGTELKIGKENSSGFETRGPTIDDIDSALTAKGPAAAPVKASAV
jgi:hypothetical protein